MCVGLQECAAGRWSSRYIAEKVGLSLFNNRDRFRSEGERIGDVHRTSTSPDEKRQRERTIALRHRELRELPREGNGRHATQISSGRGEADGWFAYCIAGVWHWAASESSLVRVHGQEYRLVRNDRLNVPEIENVIPEEED